MIVMSNITTYYQIPSLRKITKFINKICQHCVRYRVMFSLSPKLVPVPKQRTQEFYSLQVIEADHAGPIYYRSKNKAISKSYISLFSCSVSGAILLELVPNLTIKENIKFMKRLITRRRSPKVILTLQRHFQMGLSGLPELIHMRSFTFF